MLPCCWGQEYRLLNLLITGLVRATFVFHGPNDPHFQRYLCLTSTSSTSDCLRGLSGCFESMFKNIVFGLWFLKTSLVYPSSIERCLSVNMEDSDSKLSPDKIMLICLFIDRHTGAYRQQGSWIVCRERPIFQSHLDLSFRKHKWKPNLLFIVVLFNPSYITWR